MIWVIILLAIIFLLGSVNFLLILAAHARLSEQEAEHGKCLAGVMMFVGDSFAANVLRAAAEDYDASASQFRIRQMAREYDPDGLSIPAMWLLERADSLKPVGPEQ